VTPILNLIVATPPETLDRFQAGLSVEPRFEAQFVIRLDDLREALHKASHPVDVVVLNNLLGDMHDLVKEIRALYPRLIIILVDEEADFALPGRADDISTAPFQNNDLITRIKRLTEDRQLQTLRADALPPVRAFAKSIMKPERGKTRQQAAVQAVQELGYDYVAYYTVTRSEHPELILAAQVGPEDVLRGIPYKPAYDDSIIGSVAQTGQSRRLSSDDHPNHPLILKKRFQGGVCSPVGTNLRFGVLVALKEKVEAITPEHAMMLELICAQLASALAKEQR